MRHTPLALEQYAPCHSRQRVLFTEGHREMKPLLVTLLITLLTALAAPPLARAGLTLERGPNAVKAKGDHFAITIDMTRGGEISELLLHDGSQWNSVLGDGGATFPGLTFSTADEHYALANDTEGKLVSADATPEKVVCKVSAVPRSGNAEASPWEITTTYEVYAEGAVFIDLDCRLNEGEFALSHADVSFPLHESLRQSAKYRDQNVSTATGGFSSARVAFGKNAARNFTNEIEIIVERKQAMAGAVGFEKEDGRFTWTLGGGGAKVTAPCQYQNRIALGLGAAVTGKPKSNVIGQRVYHWVNWLDTENWYPTGEQIDRMAANGATMLILHHEWMLQRGSNGNPHADYAVVRNHEDMAPMIEYAHGKGLRVGLYMRGVEMYALETGFFPKHCKRNWDGIYVDWHGPGAVSWHENRYDPETQLGDSHFSEDGTYVPAREYFLFTKKLRHIVGPGGFLIGHQGSFNSGVFANLCFDAYLPGETGSDREMFSDLDEAAYKGMLGGGVCMPWTLDLPRYRNAEGAAKMAAWGFYPHIVMGIKARHTKDLVFPLDPDDPLYAFVLPYWRILANIDVEKATVHNLPSQNVVAATSSNPDFHSVVYKAGGETYLLITANLGSTPSSTELALDTKLLGMSGEYEVERIDPATGEAHPSGKSAGTITTAELPQWGIEGFKLTKE